MPLPPPLPVPGAVSPALRTESDLRTLATLHAVMAWPHAAALVLLAAFLAFGIRYEAAKNAAGQAAARASSGQAAIIVSSVLLALGPLAFNGNVIAARCLRRRHRRGLCQLGAALAALAFPLGTLLSAWTLLVLQRPAAVALFRNRAR
ncbi:hypothetical protein [Xanthomonas cerealis]|uniref:hypothetical protein n=1 Tax=Xanthomonas cerealis TaxID=3390025 RepID=UPI000579622D|nr:hypothetical protein [Xanthomonas translucens]UKE48260.1 hypothetical protein KHA79_06400 [Xanthomonas translucens pv. cerealis]